MTFQTPENSLYFLLIPILIGLFVWSQRRRHKQLADFISPKQWPRLISISLKSWYTWKFIILLIALSMIMIGLLRPQYGTHVVETKRKGIDILIALDTSESMLAQDVSPNRFEQAKQEIIRFLDTISGDRVGLIGFSGTAKTHSPPHPGLRCPKALCSGYDRWDELSPRDLFPSLV